MVINRDPSTYISPFTIVILDATDAYYYADIMDNMEPFDTVDDLELAKMVANALFIVKNYKWESLKAMNNVDGGYDIRIYDKNMSCVYAAHELFKENWIGKSSEVKQSELHKLTENDLAFLLKCALDKSNPKLQGPASKLLALIGSTNNHIKKQNMNNDLTYNDFDSIMPTISKVEVEKQDLRNILKIFNDIKSDKQAITKLQGKVQINFHGYDNDQRELFEIEEVKNWIKKFIIEEPDYFYFLDVKILKLFVYCALDAVKIVNDSRKGYVFIQPEILRTFIEQNILHLHKTFEKFNTSPEKKNIIIVDIVKAFDLAFVN